jgi:hypothetical protein
MIKIGDKVFHAYNGNLKGTVRSIRLADVTVNLDAGPPMKQRIATVEVVTNGQQHLVEAFVKDLMVDV